eukprot:CAMPEP_0116067958 /NCGR_PEP_ID=MMETSP0322-20121206/11375_1 /TAXON_ID=163516 /ORGANISM="Leptocylindrus danicus var. apora, Strain B651" /LENGTH=305 /DNA_ID=CAMNT_0003554977 /DNA_START=108 /DNA_END=1025 /DNA_ORIENTATION=+
MPSTTKKDDIQTLMARLYVIQEEVGAKVETKENEKKQKKTPVGRGERNTAAFDEKKNEILDALQDIVQQIKDIKGASASLDGVLSRNTAKDRIQQQSQVREKIRAVGEDWTELDRMYRAEARKRRTKISKEQLKQQQDYVINLKKEIEKVKDLQRKAFSNSNTSAEGISAVLTHKVNVEEYRDIRTMEEGQKVNLNLTKAQQQQLKLIEEKDQEFDERLAGEINNMLDDLAFTANKLKDEVQEQNVLLEELNEKAEEVGENIKTTNEKLKTTLTEVGRSGDKLIMDIICVVLACGFLVVIWNFAT